MMRFGMVWSMMRFRVMKRVWLWVMKRMGLMMDGWGIRGFWRAIGGLWVSMMSMERGMV